jgi:hypothetical protein
VCAAMSGGVVRCVSCTRWSRRLVQSINYSIEYIAWVEGCQGRRRVTSTGTNRPSGKDPGHDRTARSVES